MKANELRKGVLVTITNPKHHPKMKDVPLSVTHIGPYAIGLEHINQKKNTYYETYSQFLKFIEPITLTEEWLIKFGYETKEGSSHDALWVMKHPTLNIDLLEQAQDMQYVYMLGNIAVYIDYVHQLQNLYFALTREELTLALSEKHPNENIQPSKKQR